MGYVYRYIDPEDNIIKYVGIVYGETRTLQQRINEHKKYDNWCKNKKWIIEYIESDISTRTDAEYFESHYISLYRTDKWFNSSKSGWGISNFLPDKSDEWLIYDKNNNLKHKKSFYKDTDFIVSTELYEEKIKELQQNIINLRDENIKLQERVSFLDPFSTSDDTIYNYNKLKNNYNILINKYNYLVKEYNRIIKRNDKMYPVLVLLMILLILLLIVKTFT